MTETPRNKVLLKKTHPFDTQQWEHAPPTQTATLPAGRYCRLA